MSLVVVFICMDGPPKGPSLDLLYISITPSQQAQCLMAVAAEVEGELKRCRGDKRAAGEKLRALEAEAKKLTVGCVGVIGGWREGLD